MTKTESITKKILIKIGYWFPVLLFVFFYKKELSGYAIVGNTILALGLVLFVEVFNHRKIHRWVNTISVLLFNVVMFVQIAHLHLFNNYIKATTFFIIFDTNASETGEFFSTYLDFWVLFILFALITVSVLTIYSEKFYIIEKKTIVRVVRLLIFGFFLLLIGLFPAKIKSHIFPFVIYEAVDEYRENRDKFDKITADKYGGDFTNVEHKDTTKNAIYVLVIGESTTRHHMQLYGYYRENNPRLTQIKDELVIFNNVISPHTHTNTSLSKVLTLASFEEPERKFDGTVVQLFNKTGFRTYWISNQKPTGIYDTEVASMARNCEEKIFVSQEIKKDKEKKTITNTLKSSFKKLNSSLDEKVLVPLKIILDKKENKKFIIVHLMGTHAMYSNRYPNDFEKFTDNPKTKFKHKKAYKNINSYDNAILYNDYIVSEIISQVKKTDTKSYVLYISDHGEDVFQTRDMTGHTETDGTKPMYDIPFLLWRSEKFKSKDTAFVYNTNRKYITEDLLYTLSNLSDIHFNEFDSTKSIVNKHFKPKKRMILEGEEYDEYFK